MPVEPFVDHESIPVMAPRLQDEIWFHGSITRQHAEALLKHVSYTSLIKSEKYFSFFISCIYLFM